MALDDLKATIETLRKRIHAHRAYLEGETPTRQVLIDPMLRVLGWDVEDPNSVQLEYEVGVGKKKYRLDYVLMEGDKPIAVIEAKAFGNSLDEDAMIQAINYAVRAKSPYIVLTNGNHWRMVTVPEIDQVLMEFRLTQDEPYACALQALGLWRPNLASGEPPKEATVPTTPEQSNNGDWRSLTLLKVESGQKAPASIRFSNSSPKPIKNWTELLVSVAEHLVETGKISAGDCPVPAIKGNQNLLHTNPTHPTGSKFHSKRKIGNLWLNTHFPTPDSYEHSRWLIEQFGDPSTVLVSNPS